MSERTGDNFLYNEHTEIKGAAAGSASEFSALLSADMPEELYDGWAVYRELDEKAKQRTSAENISDVLDAVVRLIKKREGV